MLAIGGVARLSKVLALTEWRRNRTGVTGRWSYHFLGNANGSSEIARYACRNSEWDTCVYRIMLNMEKCMQNLEDRMDSAVAEFNGSVGNWECDNYCRLQEYPGILH
jgi:hypothetical protein